MTIFQAVLAFPLMAEEEVATVGEVTPTESAATPAESAATPVNFDSPSYKRRPYVVSIFLREEYDTNIFTSELDPKASFKTIAEPELTLSLANSRSYLGLRYRNSTIYYDHRPGDPFDIGHYFDLALNHEFNTRCWINVTDNFRYTQEPELLTDTAFVRREGTYKQNSFNTELSYYLTRRLYWNAGFGHDWWEYDDPFYAFSLDRTSYTGTTGLNFIVSPRTTASITYQYVDTEFRESPRDSKSHIVYLGLLQKMTPQWTLSIQGGGQYRKAEESKAELAPFAAAETNWNFLPTSVLTVGYNTSLQDTDQTSFNYSQTQHVYAKVNARLSYDLTLNVTGDYILNTYPGNQNLSGNTEDAEEKTLVYRVALSYAFTPQWLGEVAYTYTTVDSDFFGSSYDRSQASVGMKYTY